MDFSLMRFSSLSLLISGLMLISCSKKDVKADISPEVANASATNAAGAASDEDAGPLKAIHFDYNADILTKEARQTLQSNAEWMKNNPKAQVQLEGHCDERGTPEFNLALGDRRARSAQKYLVKFGVDASRISTISFGKERPIDSGHDEIAWAKNRRVVSVVTSQ